jgi:hypothetical protein
MNKAQAVSVGTLSPIELEILEMGDHDEQTWKLLTTVRSYQGRVEMATAQLQGKPISKEKLKTEWLKADASGEARLSDFIHRYPQWRYELADWALSLARMEAIPVTKPKKKQLKRTGDIVKNTLAEFRAEQQGQPTSERYRRMSARASVSQAAEKIEK